ncbi:MAG: DUF805 domain-containing protein [Bacteroidales bacterium]|nr:DUF805 domain-containing protein [Bacteroidales bacterium]
MGFVESIKTCYSKYLDFDGKASRSEFWWFFLAAIVINWVITSVVGGGFLGWILQLAITGIPSLAAGVRRLRDAGFNPLWILLIITGIGIFVLFFMWAKKK